MSGARVPFDSSQPFIVTAASGVPCGGKRFEHGALFPWRELGISESDLAAMWVSNQVDVASSDDSRSLDACRRKFDETPRVLNQLPDPTTNRFLVTPSERVNVETPSQRKRRKS